MSPTNTQRRLVPINEVCEELGSVSRSTVYDLINQGLLTKVSIGRRAFVPVESLDSYVESLSQPPQRD